MKTSLKMTLGAVLWTAMVLQPSSLLAQGSLSPPGPPAPTMKTLQQVEPRVPISSAPFTISQPGSYYLTTNLTVSGGNAITIATNGVTLDLNGFTISSTTNPASGTAVLIGSGLRNIAIQNGHIQGGVTNDGSGVFSGPGFGYGIYYSGSAPQNLRVSGVSVSGCLYAGIYVGDGASTTVENCVVRTVGSFGILANTIRGCVALDCGGSAIYGQQVSDSRGQSVSSNYGLYAYNAQNCSGYSSSGTGLSALTAQNCYGYSGSAIGLSAYTAVNCYGASSSGTGLYATTAQNCYGSSGSGYGLYAFRVASGCYGSSSSGTGLSATTALNCYGSSSGSGYGLYASRVASGCYGSSSSGTGLYAFAVNNCYGESGGDYGIYAYDIAIGSYGWTSSGPYGLRAFIANSCDGNTLSVSFKYNMP
jgi:hypothetical protein